MYFYVVFNSVFGIVKHTAFLYVVGKKRNVQKTFHNCRIYCWTGKPGFLSMKWTALNCKRHQTSLTERWKARVCIEDAVCLVPRVRPRSLCAWQIPYERQSNVQNYNRGIFDLSLSFVHSVEFRFVAGSCLDSSSIGWWLQTIQFKRDSLFLWKEWVEGLIRFSKGKRN